MAETDSTEEAAMSESSNLMMKARDLLATPNHEGLAFLVDQLFTHRQSVEYQTSRRLYDFCVANFSNCLTLNLLKVYLHSSEAVLRFRSIVLLSETLTKLRNRGFELSPVALNEIKPLLISCLTMPKARKSDAKILRIIVSSVAFNVMMLGRNWDELGDCILSLANSDPLRAFNVFLDLPPVNGAFINRFLHKLLEEVLKVLYHPELDKEEDWILALETAIKLGILDSESRREILDNVLKSSNALVSMGMEQILQEALQHLVKFLEKEASLCKWSKNQCGFMAEFSFRIGGIGGRKTKESAKKIFRMVTEMENYVPDPSLLENQDLDRYLYNTLTQKSALEILQAFSAAELDDRTREVAIRRLHDLLCDHTSGNGELDVAEIENLQPLLISCLQEAGMPENTFKILAQVVYHVAVETFSFGEDPWFDLWDYIGESKRDFKKAVYVFQCLTMRLSGDKEEFMIRAVNSLVPEISSRLNPPRELLVDNSSWVLAFNGAFCASIRLVNVVSHGGIVKEIEEKMVDSVRELVERGMEVGLVRRGFRDVESIVEQQWDWYKNSEFRFVKGLIRRLYEIKGMKMESKIVLWRINVVLEKSVGEEFKISFIG
ncbi:unnamed protein product [Microthlaspi erraticum]|uniref:DUF577 domain-containing protein n=1 Tax=Microthlaspi erraticum TaxID=1685480 RepID=A0A6D2KTP2_9BRAS|nr:unnamed protein product [Microthlaspi erraticum]